MGVVIAIVLLVVVFAVALGKIFSPGDPSQRDAILLILFGVGAAIFKFLAERVDMRPGFRMILVRIGVMAGLLVCGAVCLYEILMLTGADAGSL